MRKPFTKIICIMTAAITALGAGILSACGDYKSSGVTPDATADKVSSNGGFLVETGDYVYFINGVAGYQDDNTYGKVVKGSIQRISKSNLNAHNYSDTETIVPVVVYSGNYEAGIYIYGDYIYYTTPSTQKNSDGEVQNSYLEFKRSKLDGSSTMKDYFFQSESNSIAYRYVEIGGTVYLMYAASESLYGTSTTNIHSINTSTGVDTLLAYNVSEYAFDTDDAENPYVYYTMAVTGYLGSDNSFSESYNQMFRVRADATESERTYDFSYVEDFDAEEDPLYVNLGDFVFDGLGIMEQGNAEERVTQFNYNYGSDVEYVISHHDYTYSLSSYKNGELLYTVAEALGDQSSSSLFRIKDGDVDADNDGKIDASWDAITANDSAELVLTVADDDEYFFVTVNGEDKVIYVGDGGITLGTISDGKLTDDHIISDASSASILAVREETTLKAESDTETQTNLYVYYSGSKNSTEGVYRIAADGAADDYERNKMQTADNWAYKDVRLLDVSILSDWYAAEFVGNQLIFPSSTEGMSSFNYIMALDLTGSGGYIMSNEELNAYTEKYDGVFETIEEYDEELNSDGSAAYENLSDALKYLFYSGDADYLAELIQAYVDIEGRSEEYVYSTASAQIYLDFAAAQNDWEDYKTDTKTVNGETVTANFQIYYYGLLGAMTDDDAEDMLEELRSSYMQAYPEDASTWWEGLNTAAKVCFIVGMCVAGLLVIGGGVLLTLFLIRRKKRGDGMKKASKLHIDITDDRSIDVYGDESERAAEEEKSHTASLDD